MHIGKDLLLVWLLIGRVDVLLEDFVDVSLAVEFLLAFASFRALGLVALIEEFEVFPLVCFWREEFVLWRLLQYTHRLVSGLLQ